MIATHGQMQTLRVGIPPACDFTDAPLVNIRGISVLFIAGDDATFAADALRHVEVKAALLAGRQCFLRDFC